MLQNFKLFQDSDFVTGLLLLVIASATYAGIGSGAKDWVFPLMACFALFGISIVFFIKSSIKIFSKTNDKDLVVDKEQIPSIVNVVFFSLIVFGFLFVLFAFGFWIASFIFLFASISYFSPTKNIRGYANAFVISLIACSVAYVVFTHVFYVPFPESRLFG
ncbi:MAG: Uncharacterised protein [SAR116 cluster bacterium]|jgi:hypothetical protein|nr:MAG: Uncharacterised protein [SAR116 cluster bacterium]|tara:strand:- start:37 stop:519 length:483 start_codon:yes stop_codon:yes gene_type:complete